MKFNFKNLIQAPHASMPFGRKVLLLLSPMTHLWSRSLDCVAASGAFAGAGRSWNYIGVRPSTHCDVRLCFKSESIENMMVKIPSLVEVILKKLLPDMVLKKARRMRRTRRLDGMLKSKLKIRMMRRTGRLDGMLKSKLKIRMMRRARRLHGMLKIAKLKIRPMRRMRRLKKAKLKTRS